MLNNHLLYTLYQEIFEDSKRLIKSRA